MLKGKKTRLGDLLIARRLINQEQLDFALKTQRETGLHLGHILVSQGALKESELLKVIADQMEISFFDLRHQSVPAEIVQILPEAYARRFRAIVLANYPDSYRVGFVDPMDIHAIDQVEKVLDKPIQVALVREEDLLHVLDLIYRRTTEIEAFAEALEDSVSDNNARVADFDLGSTAVNSPVVQLLRSVFEDAIQVGASDIHIEPQQKSLRIRLRVDGALTEQMVKDVGIAKAILTRLKLMAELNIAEYRLPQDGRFSLKVRDRVIDVRLATVPTQQGEAAVMRLLDQRQGIIHLDKLGMSADSLHAFKKLLSMPNGVIIVTGPTGSGKTTTLAGALRELNTAQRKIITVEDPIEYEHKGASQIQVNPKIGLTFPVVLRSSLRQDPDVIFVGEMRDSETAEVAVRAALTGRLVLTTLHTNDAASTPIRLMDMGVESFLLSATLRGILAQRLVRKICTHCQVPYTLNENERMWWSHYRPNSQKDSFKIGEGCHSCHQTGYRGRTGVFELLLLDYDSLDSLRRGDLSAFVAQAHQNLKGCFLLDDALRLVESGITTVREAMHVGGEL